MLTGFGKYHCAGASQSDCSSAKTGSNLLFEATDWSTCNASLISTSGGGILHHWSRPSLPIDSYLPRGCKVVLSFRQTEVRLPSNRTAAAFMKSGCVGAMEAVSCS